MSSRTWVKLYCDRWFSGSIRKESLEVRAIWVDVIALAGRTGFDGVIALPGCYIGYSDDQFAAMFNVDLDTWRRVKDRLANHPDPDENRIIIDKSGVIRVLNWEKYQSEYARQSSYRQKDMSKISPDVTSSSYKNKLQETVTISGYTEKEKEKEKETEREREKNVETGSLSELELQFQNIVAMYPEEKRHGTAEGLDIYRNDLISSATPDEIPNRLRKAISGYLEMISIPKKDGFKQDTMKFSKFMDEWMDHENDHNIAGKIRSEMNGPAKSEEYQKLMKEVFKK